MKLWRIERTDDDLDYEEYDGFVIRAESAERAREMVLTSSVGYVEGTKPFAGFNANNIKVTELTTDGPEEIVISDYLPG